MWKVLKSNKSFVFCSITAIFAAVVIANTAAANERIAEDNKNGTPYVITSKQWLNNTKEVVASPASWDNSDWNKALLFGGLTYFIHDNDDKVQHHFQENRNGTTNDIAKIGNALPVAGAVYLAGNYFYGNERQRKVAVNGLESTASALLITEALGLAVERNRPSGDGQSFPSTHVAAAFAMATVVADEYHENKAVAPLAYGLATLTAYGRLNDNKHWASDVFIGGLIGHYTAKKIIKLNASKKYTVQPYVGRNNAGVMVSKQF